MLAPYIPSFLPETDPYVLSHFRQPIELNGNKIRKLAVALVKFKMKYQYPAFLLSNTRETLFPHMEK
jgi:hypothetical protein